jgi:ferredoxin
MRIIVDLTVCDSHGQCALVAPDIFTLDENLDLHYQECPSESLRDAALEAVLTCPTQAIKIED